MRNFLIKWNWIITSGLSAEDVFREIQNGLDFSDFDVWVSHIKETAKAEGVTEVSDNPGLYL